MTIAAAPTTKYQALTSPTSPNTNRQTSESTGVG